MIAICMTETICRSCGSEEPDVTKIGGICKSTKFCMQSLWWICVWKVHLHCRNADSNWEINHQLL